MIKLFSWIIYCKSFKLDSEHIRYLPYAGYPTQSKQYRISNYEFN